MTYLINLLLILNLYSTSEMETNPYVQISKDFLTTLKNGENTDDYAEKYANFSDTELAEGLQTNEARLAFWINTYNAFIQRKLQANPELYENRGSFFKNKFINIGGNMVAFADIEHGIIRRSQFEYFLGYVTNPFAGSWERKLRVKQRDFRVHFALNCGAKSCPPVGIYDDTKLDEQLDISTTKFLNTFTELKDDKIHTTSLFSWFRGDFGGIKGAKNILVKYDIIDESDKKKDFDLSYDWTLYLDNYVEF